MAGSDKGNVDLTQPRRNGPHRIACHIAKYIAKTLENAVFNAKGYWSRRGIPNPKKRSYGSLVTPMSST